jgi:hypothetical protein
MSKPTRVQFVVDEFGDDASVVTELIGFEPTSIAVCGFSSLPSQTSWLVGLAKPVPEKLEDHIAGLLRTLEPHSEGIRQVASRFRARILIYVDDRDWIWPYEPDGPRFGHFEISPNLIAAASRLGIGFIVHFTCGLKVEDR